MIGEALTAMRPGSEFPKPKAGDTDAGGRACGGGMRAAAAVYASSSESLHLKYTSKDGDVLELDYERREEVFAGVALSSRGAGPARDPAEIAGGNAEAAVPPGPGPEERLKKLAQLRDWAAQVAEEVRKQQQKILEEFLKRSGRFEHGCEGRIIVVQPPADAVESEEGDCEAGIPEYWNAENTSDRIVHFATQMAEIAGGDAEFAETIIQAVADGFDQANAEIGPLPGKAGELNRKTRELTFAKLSEWLEERKAGGYNQGARNLDNPNLAASHGTENHEQRQNSPVHSEGENRLG